mgnify:CR=1 FL=1
MNIFTITTSGGGFASPLQQAITPKGIAGVDTAMNLIIGWTLWGVSVLSLVGLLVLFATGFEAYRHNQGEAFMEKAKAWVIAAAVGAYAKDIVKIFFPSFTNNVIAVALPGMEGPVKDIIGNIVWAIQWIAFIALLFLAVSGFIAFKNDGVQEFISKFFWWIVAALGTSLATNIAGAFFPAVLTMFPGGTPTPVATP